MVSVTATLATMVAILAFYFVVGLPDTVAGMTTMTAALAATVVAPVYEKIGNILIFVGYGLSVVQRGFKFFMVVALGWN